MDYRRPKRDTMSLEKATVSNMREIAAVVKVLERKGICTNQDLFNIIIELRKKNPCAKISERVLPRFHERFSEDLLPHRCRLSLRRC